MFTLEVANVAMKVERVSVCLRVLLQSSSQACIMLSIPPPGGGGNKIKWFGDGEENQKLEKKKKGKF